MKDAYRLSVIISTDLAKRAKHAAVNRQLSLLKFAAYALELAVKEDEEEQDWLRRGYRRAMVDGSLVWVKGKRRP